MAPTRATRIFRFGGQTAWLRPSRAASPRERSRRTCLRIPATRGARALTNDVPRRERGSRECRVLCCTRSLVCEVKKHTSKSLQVKPNKRHSPRDGVNAYFRALPGVRDVLVTVACGIPARRTRQGRRRQSASLAPAQGRQNHTISSSATCRARRTRCRVHRIPPHVS